MSDEIPDTKRIPLIKKRFMALRGVIDIRDFLSGWFHGAPFEVPLNTSQFKGHRIQGNPLLSRAELDVVPRLSSDHCPVKLPFVSSQNSYSDVPTSGKLTGWERVRVQPASPLYTYHSSTWVFTVSIVFICIRRKDLSME